MVTTDSRPDLETGWIDTPVGRLRAVTTGRGVRALLWPEHPPHLVRFASDPTPVADSPLLVELGAQLASYFAGERRTFDLPLDLTGTPFQLEVWAALGRIPFGATITYGELAGLLGRPGSARAVGTAVGRNPVSIIVPCHRVVGADGSLTGFAGGLDVKARLLELEAAP